MSTEYRLNTAYWVDYITAMSAGLPTQLPTATAPKSCKDPSPIAPGWCTLDAGHTGDHKNFYLNNNGIPTLLSSWVVVAAAAAPASPNTVSPFAAMKAPSLPTNHSAYITLTKGYVPPGPLEDLPSGIKFCWEWQNDPWCPPKTKSDLQLWAAEATKLMGSISMVPPGWGPSVFSGLYAWLPDGTDTSSPLKPVLDDLPPQICIKCKFKNDYAGHEHLSTDGTYTCRSCK